MEDNDMMPLICIRCKKDIPLTVKTFEEVSYTHYSYCEECLRKGLKALKAWDLLYKRIYDHHYEILKMEEGEVKRAKLSLSNWVLDLMTGELDYDYVPNINVGEMAESEEEPAEWIVDTDDSRRWDRVRFYCSSCNSWNTYGKSKYCPNCGAKMKEEKNED